MPVIPRARRTPCWSTTPACAARATTPPFPTPWCCGSWIIPAPTSSPSCTDANGPTNSSTSSQPTPTYAFGRCSLELFDDPETTEAVAANPNLPVELMEAILEAATESDDPPQDAVLVLGYTTPTHEPIAEL
ncbi:hypothetical protein [Actinoplanes solisilvae]|uniref:hypothetical protein n=1 Tax=Actinoplanes solisilvae TaxID=2486853 RepID=UPI000FD87DEF|nr:hypothetical protein [Actinoplanes solisilvae]